MGIGIAVTKKKSWIDNPEVAKKARKIPAHLDAFLPIIKDNIAYADDNARLLSWRYLEYHSEMPSARTTVLYSTPS